ncbi:MAG: hypothetical protein WD740_03620 [Anaerolineales bacterium]
MDFGSVLRRSWEIIWKNKVLWIFGILASCSGGGANFGGGGFNYSTDQRDMRNLPLEFQRWGQDFERFINEGGMALIVAFICAALVIGQVIWVIGKFGKVGLIKGILKADAGRPVSFSSLASESWGMLGSALGLNFILILIPIAAVIVLVLLAIPIGIVTLGIGLVCMICLFVPLALAYGVYTQLANVALVRDQQGVGLALSRAWDLMRSKLGPLAGIAIILILGGFVVGVILLVPMAAIALPAILGFISKDPNAVGGGLLTSGILLLIALPFYLAISGLIQSYLHSAWTLTYLQLSAPAAPVRASRAKAKK